MSSYMENVIYKPGWFWFGDRGELVLKSKGLANK